MGSMSAHCPNKCTGMMALVLDVILDFNWVVSRLKVSGLMSQNTGVAPTRVILPTVAKKVNGVVMTKYMDAYKEDGLFLLTMHPHVIGHRSRILILRGKSPVVQSPVF